MSNREVEYELLLKKNQELQKENEQIKGELKKLLDEEVIKLYRALESSAEAIFMTDLDGNITYINPEFTKLYGFTSDEIIGKVTPRILKSGMMSPESYEYFWETILNKEVVKGEMINRTKDGRLITIEGSANPILNEEQKIIGFIGVQHDISLRKKSEEALKRSEELFRKAFMTSPDAVNINRLSDGLYVLVNKGFAEIMGYTEEEVIGKTSLELNIWVDPANRKILVEKIKLEGAVSNFEALFRKKNGEVVTGLMSASVFDIDSVPHIISETKDITRQRQVDQAFEQQRFLISAMMKYLPDHVYFKDLESRFVMINESHAKSLGLSDPWQAVGKTDRDFHSADHAEMAREDEKTIIKTGETIIKEEKIAFKNGVTKWILATKLPLRDSTGKVIGTFGVSRDITKMKQAEEALKLSEERLRSVTESANAAIITTDINETIIAWNRGAEIVFGYTEKEVVGKSLKILVHGDFHKRQAQVVKLLKMGGGKYMTGKTVELNAVRKGGEVFPVELSISEWKTSEGQFFTGILRDITNRKRAELENQILYEITNGITTTSNLDELLNLMHKSLGKVVYAENIFVALHNPVTGLFDFAYFVDKIDPVPEPTAMEKSCSAYVFRTLKPFLFNQEAFNILHQQGEVEQVGSESPSWIGIPLKTPSRAIGVLVLQHYEEAGIYNEGDVRFLSSIGNQIAIAIDRKQSETALFESEKDLLEAHKIAELGTYSLDRKTDMWTSSKILDTIFGIDENYVRTVEGWLDLVHPSYRDEMHEYLYKEIFERKSKFDKEYLIVRKNDGAERWVTGKGELIFESGGKLIAMVGTIMDITDRRKAEEEIKLKNELLQLINAEKDKFFSILAHDLRGPLSAFVAATQIITEEIQNMELEEIREITNSMKTSATNIYSLLENLLEWSRLRRGGLDFVPVKTALKEKIVACIDVLSESARKKEVDIGIDVAEDTVVMADSHMFDTVIRNLVSNAIKFSNVGGEVKISANTKSDQSTEIIVKDSGIGMTAELKSKLFLINEKTSRKGTQDEPSTGLGLLLCKEFIEKHGGTIWVESEVGKGSSFGFTLPVSPDSK